MKNLMLNTCGKSDLETKEVISEVYAQNFKCLKYSQFKEFKFKIIHNILPCGKQLCNWNNNYSGLCVYCEAENISHLLYECSRIKNIWRVVSNCMKTNILLHIILGFQCSLRYL